MTNLETFLAMLAAASVRYFVGDPEGHFSSEVMDNAVTVVNVKNSPRGYGYGGFYSAWHFDANGALLGVAHWE